MKSSEPIRWASRYSHRSRWLAIRSTSAPKSTCIAFARARRAATAGHNSLNAARTVADTSPATSPGSGLRKSRDNVQPTYAFPLPRSPVRAGHRLPKHLEITAPRPFVGLHPRNLELAPAGPALVVAVYRPRRRVVHEIAPKFSQPLHQHVSPHLSKRKSGVKRIKKIRGPVSRLPSNSPRPAK